MGEKLVKLITWKNINSSYFCHFAVELWQIFIWVVGEVTFRVASVQTTQIYRVVGELNFQVTSTQTTLFCRVVGELNSQVIKTTHTSLWCSIGEACVI